MRTHLSLGPGRRSHHSRHVGAVGSQNVGRIGAFQAIKRRSADLQADARSLRQPGEGPGRSPSARMQRSLATPE